MEENRIKDVKYNRKYKEIMRIGKKSKYLRKKTEDIEQERKASIKVRCRNMKGKQILVRD